MQGITSLEGHDKANNRMRNSLRMVVPQLSDEQKDKIMQDIMQTVSPQPEPAMPDNLSPDIVNVGDQPFDMDQLQQMPMQAAEGLADMGQLGDTELAHMDPETIAMAQAMGILPEAKQNVMTGLPAFSATGGGDSGADETGGVSQSEDEASQRDDPAEVGEVNAPSVAEEAAAASVSQADLDSYDRAFSNQMSKQQEIAAMNTGHPGYDISAKTFAVPPSKLVGKTPKQ